MRGIYQRMRKFLLIVGIVGICVIVATGLFLVFNHNFTGSSETLSDFPDYKVTTVQIDGNDIKVAIADTPALQDTRTR